MPWNKDKTHCKHGHALSGDNVYITPKGRPECRTCRRSSGLRWARSNYGETPNTPPGKPRRRVYLSTPTKTHCVRGHALSGSNLLQTKKRGWRCRACCEQDREAFKNRNPHWCRPQNLDLSADEVAKITKALNSGKTITSIIEGESRPIGKMRMMEMRRLKTPLYQRFLALSQSNARIARERGVSATILRTGSWMDEVAIPKIQAAVSRHIPFFMRDDVRQELMVKVWCLELPVDQIEAAARDVMRRQYRDYDLSSKFGRVVSLDAPLFDDGKRNRYDSISEDQRLWA